MSRPWYWCDMLWCNTKVMWRDVGVIWELYVWCAWCGRDIDVIWCNVIQKWCNMILVWYGCDAHDICDVRLMAWHEYDILPTWFGVKWVAYGRDMGVIWVWCAWFGRDIGVIWCDMIQKWCNIIPVSYGCDMHDIGRRDMAWYEYDVISKWFGMIWLWYRRDIPVMFLILTRDSVV